MADLTAAHLWISHEPLKVVFDSSAGQPDADRMLTRTAREPDA
jgi:hypothetical protein